MAKNVYTLADLNTGDVLTETYLDQNNSNHASLIVPPMAQIISGTSQTIPDTTGTILTFGSAHYDTDSMWSAASPSVLTVNTDGVYLIRANIAWASSNAGVRSVSLLAGGGVVASITADVDSTITHAQSIVATAALVAADTISVRVAQTAGAPLNVAANAGWSPVLSATWLGRTTAP